MGTAMLRETTLAKELAQAIGLPAWPYGTPFVRRLSGDLESMFQALLPLAESNFREENKHRVQAGREPFKYWRIEDERAAFRKVLQAPEIHLRPLVGEDLTLAEARTLILPVVERMSRDELTELVSLLKARLSLLEDSPSTSSTFSPPIPGS